MWSASNPYDTNSKLASLSLKQSGPDLCVIDEVLMWFLQAKVLFLGEAWYFFQQDKVTFYPFDDVIKLELVIEMYELHVIKPSVSPTALAYSFIHLPSLLSKFQEASRIIFLLYIAMNFSL